MCIAILNKKGLLSKSLMKTANKNNPDGNGLLYAINGKLHSHKQLEGFKSFYKHYREVREKHPTIEIVIHFRIKTSGKIDLLNCHPFFVSEKLGFVHNGIININTDATPHLNDTQVFNNLVLKKLPKDFLKRSEHRYLIEQTIYGSKLIFLDNKGVSNILNESSGHWDEGKENWYSNSTYKEETCSYKTYSAKNFDRWDEWGAEYNSKSKKWSNTNYQQSFEPTNPFSHSTPTTKIWNELKGKFVTIGGETDELLGHCYNCGTNLYTEAEEQDEICRPCAITYFGVDEKLYNL